jgi:hypothetical protein
MASREQRSRWWYFIVAGAVFGATATGVATFRNLDQAYLAVSDLFDLRHLWLRGGLFAGPSV